MRNQLKNLILRFHASNDFEGLNNSMNKSAYESQFDNTNFSSLKAKLEDSIKSQNKRKDKN